MATRSIFFTLAWFFLLISIYGQESLRIHQASHEDLIRLGSHKRAGVSSALGAVAKLFLTLNGAVGWQGFSAEHLCGHTRSRSALLQLKVATEIPSIRDLKVYELKAICRAKGLKVSGKKVDLISRIENSPEGIERRVKHARPKNAWMLFLKKYREDHNTKGMRANKVAADAGVKWKAMTEDEKSSFVAEAESLKEEYNRQIATPTLQTTLSPFDASAAGEDAGQVAMEVFNLGANTRNAPTFNTGGNTGTVEAFRTGGGTRTEEALNSNSAGMPEVEVFSAEDIEAEERSKLRAARRAQRRERLSTYFSEEYTNVQSELQALAGPEYSTAFDSPKVESVSLLGIPLSYSVPSRPALQASLQGYKLAWCRTFNSVEGTGVLVNLDDKSELEVNREALKTSDDLPMSQRNLYPGEFVQYDPSASKLAATGTKWVSGVSDWPLMCQTCANLGLSDPFSSPENDPDVGDSSNTRQAGGNFWNWMQGKKG